MKRITSLQLIQVLKQLAMLLRARLPLALALATLIQVYKHPSLQQLLMALKGSIVGGLNLSQALQQYPKYFPLLECQLIKAGEQAAALPQVLAALCDYQEKTQQLKARVKKALFYPITVLCVAFIITIGLLLFIVPQFEQLFTSFGGKLPWFTQLVLTIARVIENNGCWFLLGIFLLITVLYFLTQRYTQIKHIVAIVKLHIPLFGRIQIHAIVARFARTLAMTTHAGVPLLQSLQLAADVANHPQYHSAIMRARESVVRGETLSRALQNTTCFSPLVIQLVHVGEQSGQLSHMLDHIAEWYESEIENTVATLSQCLEPAIMIILGLVVGSLVVAMYLPVFQLGNVV